MKLIDVKSNSYIGSSKEINNNGPKFKICCNVRISKYKSKIKKKILQKFTLQIRLKRFLWLKKLKTHFHGHLLLMIIMVKKLLECFKRIRIEKVIKRKGGKLYVKWKGYGSLFNS